MDGAPAVADSLDVGAFDVVWFSEGEEVRRPLRGAVDAGFEDVDPVREFPSYRGQRHFPGLYWAASTNRLVGFESWLERDHAILLDFDSQVRAFASQPFWLHWRDASTGRARTDAPDFFARLADGGGLVIDCRPADRVAERSAVAFTPTMAARPGEVIQIDTTPLDVLAVLDDGVTGRVELTIAVDVTTRTICAAVLRPAGTKAVDAALLLARMLVPEPMRPGWPVRPPRPADRLPTRDFGR